MDAQAAFDSIRSVASEVVTEEELKALCARATKGERPKAYIGFEPSGTAHIGWMVCTDMVRRLTAAGFDVTIFLADWHAQINDKLGGELTAIQRCGRYMEEAFEALGVPRASVHYLYASEFAKDPSYWALVLKVQKNTTLARVRRAMTIMGRGEDEGDGDMSKFMYPAMQVADIFHMGIELAYGGLDQRHAHMLARDVAPKLGKKSPVALHTPLVPSLKAGAGRMQPKEVSSLGIAVAVSAHGDAVFDPGTPLDVIRDTLAINKVPATEINAAILAFDFDSGKPFTYRFHFEKMSKSDPDSGIFIHDSPEDIARKLKGAHCPAKEVEGNPVLDLTRLVVWPRLAALGGSFTINRPEKFGGNKAYTDFAALSADFAAGALHPMDLKNGVAAALAKLLEPVRTYFAKHPDNWQFIQNLRKTR